MTLEGKAATRRRGEELEAALLEAAWSEVVENGYAELTYEGVASRAGTSRSVVYRRWPTKQELALAALRHRGDGLPRIVPDTGTLRGDLVAMLRLMNERSSQMMVLLGVHMGDFYRESGLTPAELRGHWVGDRGAAARTIVERAAERGEVPAERVTPRTVRLATDLVRHDVLMAMSPLTDEAIASIVDEVVLPVLTGAAPRV